MKLRVFFFIIIAVVLLFVSGCATFSKTPLMNASAMGDSLSVQRLIKEGANINELDSNGATPLVHAIINGKLEVATNLIETGADLKIKDKKGYDALLYAIDYGYDEISKLLIKMGADINSKDSNNATALMHAVWNGKSDIAKLLVNKGADINAKDNQKGDALIYAVDNGYYELTELLLDKGANVNSKDYTNSTPIIHAVLRTTDTKIVSLLISKGANLHEKDDEGYTPLGYALYVRKFALADEIKKGMIHARKDMPNAKIVFIRAAQFLAGAEDIFVYIDDEIVANLYYENSTDYIDIKTGQCTIVIKGGKLERDCVKSFDAEVGKTYYFEVSKRGEVLRIVGGAIGGLIDGAVAGQANIEGTVSCGRYKITPLEESVAKSKIKAILQEKK